MEAGEEARSVLRSVWVKLHGLPNASPVEQAAFFVILTFISVVLLMAALPCVSSCCCCCCRRRKTKMRGSNI